MSIMKQIIVYCYCMKRFKVVIQKAPVLCYWCCCQEQIFLVP